MNTILTTVLSTITGLIIGYLTKLLKSYKDRDNVQNRALRNILKSNLLNQYYVYSEIGNVPKNIKETWYDMFESYIELGGNSFIKHDIEPKFAKLPIKD
ncbi:MAG: hypothetical protein PUJ51_25135 [Clostridiales bacterium]|uniref:hypothetical protein n=1 Tax=Terrisporobacter sp. TaxID=1965305 RepID=UPI002A53D70F|nr:hypothetical protein [Terrisporobacter sp.]MDD7757743.1 hypothetical protein [Clostridiales bacterium]MDY3778228.1 hypothetical protein [Candidatus Onthovivens sp.]MDY3828006.1 hypothetical protein [Clostridium sp.]MDY4136478.1 hypothetical protein [Terrisporobacter sp.]